MLGTHSHPHSVLSSPHPENVKLWLQIQTYLPPTPKPTAHKQQRLSKAQFSICPSVQDSVAQMTARCKVGLKYGCTDGAKQIIAM